MRKFYLLLLSVSMTVIANAQNVTVSGALVGNGSYATLAAAFTAINGGAQTAATIAITINNSTTEPTVVGAASAILNAGTWTSISIQPSGGAAKTIVGAATAGFALIDFNGADNVTVDGLNTGGNSLTIENTTVSAVSITSTIRFINGATTNTITRCFLKGAVSSAAGTNGAIVFFTTDAVTGNGNDNNTISNCDIGPSGANLPTKCIMGNGSQGTTAVGNSGIIIDNNDIHDFFGATVSSSGIVINGGSNTWTITNNRFYQSATRTWTTGATHRPIDLNSASAIHGVQGMTVTGNIVGYASNTQTGTYTLTGSTGSFRGISFNGIPGGTVSNINSNTVASVSLTGVTSSGASNTSPFMGIFINNGLVNSNSNTIGSQSATGSLTFSTTTTSTTDVYGMYDLSPDDWTANSNNVGGISVTNLGASGTFIIYGLRATTSTAKSFNAASNNVGGTVANSIQLTSTGTSSQVVGMTTTNAAAAWTSNTVRNLTNNNGTGTTTGASVIGMSVNTSIPNHTISQNTIYNLTNTNAAAATVVTGIQFAGSITNVAERNNIYGLTVLSTSATAEINGIRVAGGTTTFRNNMIAVGAGVANAVQINGINEPAASGTDQFFHNSVYIAGSPTAGTGNSYAFNSLVTINPRSFRDNIFVNARSNSGATGKNYAVQVGGAGTNPTGLTINNNVYYITGSGTVFGRYNALDVANLAAWKTAVGQDAGSFENNPQYNDPSNATPDLHLHPTNPTVAEGNGFDVGVTDDYDGQTRASLTPVDIGADAGNFTVLDLAAPAISAITLTGTNCDLISRNITATITDLTGVDNSVTLKPRIYFRKNGGSYFSVQGSLTSGTVLNGTWTFTINYATVGGVVVSDAISYFIVAQDVFAPPNVGGNPSGGLVLTDVNTVSNPPTTPLTYNIQVVLPAGTYTVGTAGTYPTLTAAVADYNTKCMGGAIVFELLDASYTNVPTGVGESFPIIINANGDASSTNRLTIRPASGVTASMSGSSATCMIILNGADYVTIDGSNNGTSSRNLTITNTNAGISSAVVCIESLGAGLGATNNIVKNTNMIGTTVTATDGTLFGVFAGSAAISSSSNGADNDNNTIQNNNITKTQFGIYSGGASAANKNTGTVISQNVMNAASPNNLNNGGIYVRFDNGALISQNDISVLRNDGTTGLSNTAFGIALGLVPDGTVTIFTGSDVTGASVLRNKINGVTQLDPVGYSAFGIVVNSVTSGTNLVANNMISGVISASTSPDFSAGIVAGGGSGSTTNIYYNSVSMTGDRFDADFPSYGLAIGSGDPTVDVRNNILLNTQSASGIGGAKMYAIGTGSTTFANMTSNYNDLIVSGGSNFVGQTGGLGVAGTDRTTLANWQAATSKDANSKNVTPVFVSSSDLHLSNAPLANCQLSGKATPISVVVDYDNEARDVSAPDIGADEFTSVSCVLPISLLNFSGYKDGSRNQLRWTTSSEQNNTGFEVQRSTDGINYTAIGFVNSQATAGNSVTELHYAFTDNNVTGSRQYYRLRQVDFDNHSKLSNIVLIKGDKPASLTIDGLFPNPASALVNVLIATPNKDKVTLVVTDIAGRTVAQQLVNVDIGSNTVPLDISRLANGTYMVKLVCGSDCESAVGKFVKQ